MRVVQVFLFFVMLSLACVFVRGGFPSIEMWFDLGEDRWFGLSKVGMEETVGIRQVMWLVMLECAKNRILGVDTPRQHVPPRVQYGTTCWLIRKALVSLSCQKHGTGMAIPMRPQGARGVMRVYGYTQKGETLAIAEGAWGYTVIPNKEKPMAKQDIRSGVNLHKGM
jgi:hypothetical protein